MKPSSSSSPARLLSKNHSLCPASLRFAPASEGSCLKKRPGKSDGTAGGLVPLSTSDGAQFDDSRGRPIAWDTRKAFVEKGLLSAKNLVENDPVRTATPVTGERRVLDQIPLPLAQHDPKHLYWNILVVVLRTHLSIAGGVLDHRSPEHNPSSVLRWSPCWCHRGAFNPNSPAECIGGSNRPSH